jgi:hypothetical protein
LTDGQEIGYRSSVSSFKSLVDWNQRLGTYTKTPSRILLRRRNQ